MILQLNFIKMIKVKSKNKLNQDRTSQKSSVFLFRS